jgi:hypothetical protein
MPRQQSTLPVAYVATLNRLQHMIWPNACLPHHAARHLFSGRVAVRVTLHLSLVTFCWVETSHSLPHVPRLLRLAIKLLASEMRLDAAHWNLSAHLHRTLIVICMCSSNIDHHQHIC